MLSGLGIRFQILNLLHFDQIISLKSLSINLFLLSRLNVGLQLMRLPVQASQEAHCSEREREKEGCLNGIGTYMPGTVLTGCRLFKRSRNLPASTVLQGCRRFKRCRIISADTVLQGCSCLSSVATYLPALCCRGEAV